MCIQPGSADFVVARLSLFVGILLAVGAGGRAEVAELPRATPESQGVSSASILEFIRIVDSQVDAMHSCMLLRHGHVIAEAWWAPYQASDPHVLYSLSKSFTSTAVGIAIDEGKLSLDDSVLSFFPEARPPRPSANLRNMRVRDLLCMSTGQHNDAIRSLRLRDGDATVKAFLELPVAHKPGTHFVYNTPATYVCSAIVQKVSGEKLIDYLGPRLFEPLGIVEPSWSESHEGISHGGFGLNLRTEDIARFGQLCLQRGEWQGKRLVSAEWIDAATGKQTSNGSSPNSDWDQGYGFQFWRCRHNAYRGDGAFGQYCIVIPEHDVVVAITSGVRDMQAVLQHVWTQLLPAFRSVPLPEAPEEHSLLSKQVVSLRVKSPQGSALNRTATRIHGKTYRLEANDLGLQSVSLQFDEPRATITFQSEAGRCQVVCGHQGWQRQRVSTLLTVDPRGTAGPPNEQTIGIAGGYAWLDDRRLQVRVCLYETPFHQDLTFDFSADQVVIDSNLNAWFDGTERPRLIGR